MSEPSAKPRVLIVDDDVNLRRILSLFLRNAGYETAESPDGRQALETLKRQRPDAVLLDVMMPFLDGFTLCRMIKENPQTRDIPVVICTARNRKEDLVTAIRAGAEDYIVKPFTKETVLSKIQKAIALRGGKPSTGAAVPLNRRDSPRKAANWALSWGRKGPHGLLPIYKTRVCDVSMNGLSFEFARCAACTGYQAGTVHPLCLFARHAKRFAESEPLEFILSLGDNIVVTARGKIAHVYQWPEKPRTELVGVMLTEAGPETRRHFQKYLESPAPTATGRP